jgi:hypothetical protein
MSPVGHNHRHNPYLVTQSMPVRRLGAGLLLAYCYMKYRAIDQQTFRNWIQSRTQPRPQGLPRGGARAEEDPGKIR